MKRVLLLRHAEAVASACDDHARPLSPRGRADAASVGLALKARGLTPGRAVVSNARRTQETFNGLGLDPLPVLHLAAQLYNAGPATIIAALADARPAIDCQMAVGHNPGIALAARALAGRGSTGDLARLASAFPTAALAVVRFDVASWSAITATPGELEALLWLDAASARP